MENNTSVLTLFPTFKCVLQCGHCGPNCGPQDKLGDFPVEKLEQVFIHAKNMGMTLVNISGGEPFLLKNRLIDLVKLSKKCGLKVRITSGCYWARSAASARKNLEPLAEAGLDHFHASASRYHYEWIPIENTVHACSQAIQLGIETLVSIGLDKTDQMTEEKLIEACIQQDMPIPYMYESPIIPVGRAANLNPNTLPQPSPSSARGPCPSILKHPTILPNGDVVPCAGVFSRDMSAFIGGNIHESTFPEIMDEMAKDFLFIMLKSIGPFHLMSMINHKLRRPVKDDYINICHACHDLMSDKEALLCVHEIGKALISQPLLDFTSQ